MEQQNFIQPFKKSPKNEIDANKSLHMRDDSNFSFGNRQRQNPIVFKTHEEQSNPFEENKFEMNTKLP